MIFRFRYGKDMSHTATVIDTKNYFECFYDAHRIMESGASPEIMWNWPEELGSGTMSRVRISPGLALGIGDFCVHEDLEITCEPVSMPAVLHFFSSHYEKNGYSFVEAQNKNHVFGPNPGGSIAYRQEWQGSFTLPRGVPHRSLAVYIDPAVLGQFMEGQQNCFPSDLTDISQGGSEKPYSRQFSLSHTVNSIISQVFDCPYSGALRQFYLEAKTLELVTYALAQLIIKPETETTLHASDIKRVAAVREMLLRSLENPPSLQELARLFGTNKNKLNNDFRIFFGTSIFDFLRISRLKQARKLLESREMNVTEVAFEVGYSHQQSFTRAFRNYFGTNPIDHTR